MVAYFSAVNMNNQTKYSTVENYLLFLKWRPCILGMLIGCVCTSVLGLSIGLIVHPYLLLKDQQQCPTEIQWNKCSVECGNGTQYGIKSNQKKVDGKCTVTSKILIKRPCNIEINCPVDGGWGKWKQIGSCSVTCGTGLVQLFRRCDHPVPSTNGKYCSGEQFGLGMCTNQRCAEKDLALKKDTKQISAIHPMYSSSEAVDGNLKTDKYYLCTHTNKNSKAWWAVDLGDLYDIHRVVIYGRTDCCTERLSNFDIDIFKSWNTRKLEFSNFQDGIKSKCHYQPGEVPNHVLNATCPPGTNGQFVRVQLRDINYLTLCEVQVYGISSTRLTEYSDFEFEKPYRGSKANIINNITKELCSSFCGKDSSETDCFTAYSRHGNICAVVGNSTTNT